MEAHWGKRGRVQVSSGRAVRKKDTQTSDEQGSLAVCTLKSRTSIRQTLRASWRPRQRGRERNTESESVLRTHRGSTLLPSVHHRLARELRLLLPIQQAKRRRCGESRIACWLSESESDHSN